MKIGRNLTLSRRLAIMLVATGVVAAAVTGTVSYLNAKSSLKAEAQSKLELVAQSRGELVAQWAEAPGRELSPAQLTSLLSTGEGLGDTGKLFLVGDDLRVRNGGSSALSPTVTNEAVRAALGGQTGTVTAKSVDGQNVIAAYAPLTVAGAPYALVAQQDLAEVMAPAAGLRNQILMQLAVIGLLMVGVGMFVGGRMARPLVALKNNIERVRNGDFEKLTDNAEGQDEVAQINLALNDLTDSLSAAQGERRDAIVKGAAFEGAASAMVICDANFTITHVNESMRRLFEDKAELFQHMSKGFDASKIIGTSLDVFHKNPSEQRQILADPGRQPYCAEITIGDEIVELSTSYIRGADGSHAGNVLQWEVVTEKRTNEGTLNALDKSQAVIEFMPDGTILAANDLFVQAMGYRREDLIGKHHSLFVDSKETATADYKAFWDRLARGEAFSGKFRRFAAGGREIWLQATYNPILDSKGKVYKVIKFATDITAEEYEANENNAKLTAIDRAQAVIEFDLEGTILDANKNFLSVMGYSLDDIKGRKHAMFVEEDYATSDAYVRFWDQLRSGQSNEGLFKRLGRGGKEVFINGSYHPVTDPNGKVYKVVKFATDVTEQERLRKEAEVERARRAEEQEAVVTNLAAGLQQLAEGNLTFRIDQTFPGEYEKLRQDFNDAVYQVEQAMETIVVNANAIRNGVGEISQASDDLSKRTESQAATLEETAAALNEVTEAVQQTASGAGNANKAASSARSSAEESGQVVRQAVEAMSEIEKSSGHISRIIGVIDEIAFQTRP